APPRYELLSKLGQGGAGTVWLARDLELDRRVALKFLFGVRRADLDHAGVIRALRSVAVALSRAHAEGIVHRDIKPENILIDRAGRVYLTDFGIAHGLRGDFGATMSSEGQIMGTPALMPPEQARGHHHAVDERSDVYSIGATLFTKLCGRWPFAADNIVDLLHAVIYDDPPFPRALVSTLPRNLESIILRCMRKERCERYASMRELLCAFDEFLEGATAGSSPAWFRALVSERSDAVPEAAREETPEDTDLAAAMEMAREIAAWDTHLYRVSSNLPRTYPRLDRIVERLDTILADRPATAWARFYKGVALLRRGNLAGAREEMERAIDRVPDRSGAYFELGRLYLTLFLEQHGEARQHMSHIGVAEHLEAARSYLDQAVVAFEEAGIGADETARPLEYAGAVKRLAESDFAGCVEACDAILASEPDAEHVWKLRGDAQRLAGEEPFESYDRALEIRRSFFEAALALAEARMGAEQYEEARNALQRALEIVPGLARAHSLLAHTYLLQHKAGGGAALLDQALEHAHAAAAASPAGYHALTTLAELLLERSRSAQNAEGLDEALRNLARARDLAGCQNRRGFLEAQVYMQRARLSLAAGADADADIAAILAFEGRQENVPDNAPWLRLFAQARRMQGGDSI
ncbi:MAG: protein kinase, partial [Planctomycetota bacterium]